MIGKTLGNYHILEELGRGAMGVVYKAHQVSLNRVVALKILMPSFAADPELVRRFRREAESMARLNHPYILHIYDVGQEGDVHYFAAEFIQGQSLASLVKDRVRLEPSEAMTIVRKVADALDYAHQMNVIHRDIKPGNIMMANDGAAKVADFGIATILDDIPITQENAVIGTPAYISPEQAAGKRASKASDQYSMACVLVELLTGRPPFHGGGPAAILYKHVGETPEPVSQRIRQLPESLDGPILKALSKDPSARFSTCKAFCDAMERSFTMPSKKTSTPASGSLSRPVALVRKPLRSRRRSGSGVVRWVVSLMVLGAVAGGVGLGLTRYRREVTSLLKRIPIMKNADQPGQGDLLLGEAQELLEIKKYQDAWTKAENAGAVGADQTAVARIVQDAKDALAKANGLTKAGMNLFDSLDYETASQRFRDALELNPYDTEAKSYLAACAKALGQDAPPVGVTEEETPEDTSSLVEDLMRTAGGLEAEERFGEASRAYEEVSETGEGEIASEARDRAAYCRRMEDGLSEANALLEAGSFGEAEQRFDSTLKMGNSVRARMGKAACLEGKGQVEEAVWVYGKMQELGSWPGRQADEALDKIRQERGAGLRTQWLAQARQAMGSDAHDESNRLLKLAMMMSASESEQAEVQGLMGKAEAEWKEGQ